MSDLQQIIYAALREDLPEGDITTDALSAQGKFGRAKLVAKSDLVLSGMEVFAWTYKAIDPETIVTWKFKEGRKIRKGSVICLIEGKLPSILKAERVSLNFLGHLSGIATLTSAFVQKIKGTKCKITDTRKTTPGLRALEKAAVVHGGGVNHRMSLSDQFLIKENHVLTAGGIRSAVDACRNAGPGKKIEVEVRNLKELALALESRADRIMLDNMSLVDMKKAVKLTGKKAELEASGNMSLDKILNVAKTGVNFISVGKLTHSAPSADVSLLFEKL